MYVSGMHGGHGGGKTSAFKRCVFLKGIGEADVVNAMLSALDRRPSHISYMHLLHSGGVVSKVPGYVTAFGCRNWEYACVITGVWARDLDGSQTARDVTQWVLDTAREILHLGVGAYGADLGQDPSDAALVAEAFGRNRMRLARLKHRMDPYGILAYACPLPRLSQAPGLILLITGEICAGKDFCAGEWSAFFGDHGVKASVASISDVTKKEYAATVGADVERLLTDRAYKEHHRPALTSFYHDQMKRGPWLPEEHFLHVVYSAAACVDVLLITGMRDEGPVAAFSHLVPSSRVLEVRVDASEEARQKRGGSSNAAYSNVVDSNTSTAAAVRYQPDLVFNNDEDGEDADKLWAQSHLLPFSDPKLHQLSDMVRSVPDFPRPDVEFRHLLDISQRQGGLRLSTSLLRSRFVGD
jgi:phosphomevalonate kinase